MTPPHWDPIPYELRIGVTGHRDLANPAAVAECVRALLRRLLEVLEDASEEPFGPHGSPQSPVARLDRRITEVLAAVTGIGQPLEAWALGGSSRLRQGLLRVLWSAVPVSPRHPAEHQRTRVKLTAISALAPGADQVVARAVCEVVREQNIERNRFVEAVLPLPQAVYEEDFTNPAELKEFRDLLALDRGLSNTHPEPTVCCPEFPIVSDPQYPGGHLTREDAYGAAGRHVVDTSEILIAIWDPARDAKPGGTEETVRDALDRGRLVIWLNPNRIDAGTWVLRPAAPNDHTPVPPAPRGCTVAPLPNRAKEISLNFHRLAAYNRDAAASDAALQWAFGREARELERHARECGLPDPVTQGLLHNLLPRFVRADLLSQRYRRLRDVAATLWPSAAAFAVTLMAFQVIFLPSMYWLAFVELGILVLGYASNRVSLHEDWHDKWLNDRRLAEGLRSAMYAVLASGDDRKPRNAGTSRPQDPLPFYNPANTWYVASMKREVAKARRHFQDALALHEPTLRAAVTCFLQRAWVLAQASHHRRSAQHRFGVSRRARRLRLGLIAAIAAVATAHALGVGHHVPSTVVGMRRLDLWLGFFTVMLPAWAGAVHVMLSLDDPERLAERSLRMASLLDGLAERLGSAPSAEAVRERVGEAERIMDLESAEWAESLIDRRPEFTG